MELVSVTNRTRGSPSTRAACVAVVLCALAFLGASALLDRLLPRPGGSALSTKLDVLGERFAAQALARTGTRSDAYDLLFVGSSAVFRHVDPALFDELTAAGGRPTRSYNLGVAAMEGLETLYALKRVLELDRGTLRWIVLDARTQGHALSGDNHLTARVAAWHDLPTTWLAASLVVQSPQPVAWKVDQLRRHLVAALYRLGNVGRLRDVLEPLLTGNPESRADATRERAANQAMERGRALDGFSPLDWAIGRATPSQRRDLYERRQAWVQESAELLDALTGQRAHTRPLLTMDGSIREDQELTAAEQTLLRQLVATVEERGIRVVFLNCPDVRQLGYLERAGLALGIVPGLLDTDDPERYPALFRTKFRFDRDHLNEQGAAIYTRVLAGLFLRYIRAEDHRP
jgi:hypothetical protein